MPSILWVNDNGTTSVVEVDDEGNRIDLPEGGKPIADALDDDMKFGTFSGAPGTPEPKKRGRPRKVLLDD